MSTNKIILREPSQFMADFVPVYKPVYAAFLGKSIAHPAEVGKAEFRRVEAVGDIRTKHITPKDTEIKQVAVKEGKKYFKQYFLANQFQVSNLQSSEGVDQVASQVLDELQKQMDDLFLLGEGTSDSTMINNGLFWSGDDNYTLEGSVAVDSTDLPATHAQILTTAQKADQVAGRKLLIVYGSDFLPVYNSVYEGAARAFRSVLAEALDGYSVLKMPEACTPASANGWIVANLDQVVLHYSILPKLMDRGVNAEKMYAWNNFLMGSSMLDVLAADGIVRQPCTVS